MKITPILFILCSLVLVTKIHADSLTPSEIEALRQEFEDLNSYKKSPTYSSPNKETVESANKSSPTLPTSSQFVDLDSVFNEDATNTAKRKRQ